MHQSGNARPDGAEHAHIDGRADGRRGVQPRASMRAAAACTGHCSIGYTVMGAELRATGTGKAGRTPPPAQRVPTLEMRASATARSTVSARGPRAASMSELIEQRGAAENARHAERRVGVADHEGRMASKKRYGRRRGSHRRSRSESTVALSNVATKTSTMRAPGAQGWTRGRDSCPCPRPAGRRIPERTNGY